jgi:cardiolipin synthase (CMP-forming)
MIIAKQVADLLTLSRALLVFVFPWLGLTRGAEALPLAALFLVYSWFSDSIDGPIARRSRESHHTWLGDHDLIVDMAVSIGLLVFLLASGYVTLTIGLVYIALWLLIFLYWGLQRSLGMLFQAPIYAGMILISLQDAFPFGVLQIFFILAAIVITWPRFPKEVVPGFLAGLGVLNKKKKQ